MTEFGKIDNDLDYSVRQPADIAILYNRTAGIWESHDRTENTWESDAQFIYWALRHDGYNVDVIPEEDIEMGALDNYKVLYVNGVYMRQTVASAIDKWMQNGTVRVLVGTAGTGAYTEKNASMSTLDKLFGISSATLTRSQKAGRPLYEVKSLTTITPAKIALPTPTYFDILAWHEELVPSTGTVIGVDVNNKVIAVKRTIGKNTAIRYGFLPGLTYLHEAWDQTASSNQSIATGFDIPLKDLICYGATLGATRVAQTSEPLIEATRFDYGDPGKSEGIFPICLIFLINHDYDATTQTVMVEIPDCENTYTVESVREGKLSFKNLGDGKISITLPMSETTDVLTIKHIVTN